MNISRKTPQYSIRTLPIEKMNELPLDIEVLENTARQSLSDQADTYYENNLIAFSPDLDPSPGRSLRKSLPEQPFGADPGERIWEVVGEGNNPTQPASASMRSRSVPDDANQRFHSESYQWDDGKLVFFEEQYIQNGELRISRQMTVDSKNGTLTYLELER